MGSNPTVGVYAVSGSAYCNNVVNMLCFAVPKTAVRGPLVQLEERSAHNRVVLGSSPGRSINLEYRPELKVVKWLMNTT